MALRANVAEAQLSQRFVRALTAGQVLKWAAEVGGNVSPGTPLGDFAPASRPTVLGEVDELLASRVRVGQKPTCAPRAAPSAWLWGRSSSPRPTSKIFVCRHHRRR